MNSSDDGEDGLLPGESIQQRTSRKISENQQITQTQVYILGHHIYTVHPHVFSPIIFLGTQWLADTMVEYINSLNWDLNRFIEIGTGCGCILSEIGIRCQIKELYGVDISEYAVENTKENLSKFGVMAEIFVSDVLDAVPEGVQFDMIFWNYPFHLTQDPWDFLSSIERTVRDQNYRGLRKLLKQSKDGHLSRERTPHIMLGFSQTMGDWGLLEEICKSEDFTWEKVAQMSQQGTICLLRLTPNLAHSQA